eukprot:Sspe_Gene.109391::Locus_89528_Transcript_1_1_Confidence_1.000_Length_408::g.109391::m.109391
MCIVAFVVNSHPKYPLIVIVNRDEFENRPTDDMKLDAEGILSARDKQAGGMQAGLNTHTGVFAVLTNVRLQNSATSPTPPSRGKLVEDALKQPDFSPSNLEQYAGFNLLRCVLSSDPCTVE